MKTLLTIALALAASPAIAQTQAEMDVQAATSAAAIDADMNVQYRRTMAAMKRMDGYHAPDAKSGPTYQRALLLAQRAWLSWRDAECTMRGYEFRGGSAQPMAHSQCIADLTSARTAQLKQLQQSFGPK